MLRFCILVLASLTLPTFVVPGARAQETGCRFLSEPILKPVWNDPILGKSGKYDPGDYEMQLMEDFSYIDCALQKHTVMAGTVVNGASIPRQAWSILGYTPWTGPVQKPSIIHDDLSGRTRFTSDTVHKLFHEALLHSGVSSYKAALMYAAVRNFGPQWSKPGGSVTYPTYYEGTMRLLARLISNNETIKKEIPKGQHSTYQPPYVYLDHKRLPLKGSSEDTDTVLSVLREVGKIPVGLHEEFAERGRIELDPDGNWPRQR